MRPKTSGKTLFSVPHTERPELRRRLTEQAAELRKQGLGWSRIGEQLGVSGSQLYKWVSFVPSKKSSAAQSKNPLPLGTIRAKLDRCGKPEIVLKTVKGLIEGRSLEETAERLGIDLRVVYSEWRRSGLGERGHRVLWKAGEWDSVFRASRRKSDLEIAERRATPESEVTARRAFWREHIQLQHALDSSVREALSGVSSASRARKEAAPTLNPEAP